MNCGYGSQMAYEPPPSEEPSEEDEDEQAVAAPASETATNAAPTARHLRAGVFISMLLEVANRFAESVRQKIGPYPSVGQ
ncbi:hypothetical protein Pa4123_20990 [Phytohabitans aurantiacus]|uniref:Uncharacterized protein n=1 Tax=Phytohabitans aurantiacus TaxID=3016789 RepID=A0ABQ5QU23_9ACTN|nr:hypothetical protein Pa4123_20990 [Phytohabitans aurantiacus]